MKKKAITTSVMHLKGGVGKTTTTFNICHYFADKGYKVLAIDIDPQSNLTTVMNGKRDFDLFDVFEKKKILPQMITKVKDGLDLISCSIKCATLDTYIQHQMNREQILKKALEPLKEIYDFIFFDCPPALNFVIINAVTTADYILMPYEPDTFCFEGLREVEKFKEEIINNTNSRLKFIGIVLTKFDAMRKVSKSTIHDLELAGFGDLIFESKIGISTIMSQANSANKSIFDFEPKSKICTDYTKFCDELLKKYNDE